MGFRISEFWGSFSGLGFGGVGVLGFRVSGGDWLLGFWDQIIAFARTRPIAPRVNLESTP